MARPYPVAAPPPPAEDGKGEFVLPDVEDFSTSKAPEADGGQPGRVVGLDYGQWAAAVVDLQDRPDRIAGHRHRLTVKGYRKVAGTPTVVGVPNPEVWVKPRERWLADREARGDRIRHLVEVGQMNESALSQSVVTRGSTRK